MPVPRRARVVAVLGGAFVALAAAEIALRITHWGVPDNLDPDFHFMTWKDRDYWTFNPEYPQTQAWDGDPYGRLPPGARITYDVNSRGFRGAELDPSRPKVVVLGDSFAFGMGVTSQDTFCSRIERALAPRFDPAPQLVNTGVPGYGSIEEAERLADLVGDVKPRAVVVVYVPNDPIPHPDSVDRADLIEPAAGGQAPRIVRLVGDALRRSSSDRAVEDWYASYYFGERSARWDAAKAALASMKRTATGVGAKFGVVLFPLLHRLSDSPFARIHATVADACREIGAPVLDLAPAFAKETDRATWVHPADHHPNARAHEIAAEAMAPFVEALLR